MNQLAPEVFAQVAWAGLERFGIGSTIFAVKPGDGSAREQAASSQKVLGGWANIAVEYATKRYRSNLVNWGMLPFTAPLDLGNRLRVDDLILVPGIRQALKNKAESVTAYLMQEGMAQAEKITLSLGHLTDDERQTILDGCLINFYRGQA